MIAVVRKVLQEHGGLHTPIDTLDSDADLYGAGLMPFAAIKVVLALERELGVEFPAAMLRRQNFRASLQSSTLSPSRASSSRTDIAEQREDHGEIP